MANPISVAEVAQHLRLGTLDADETTELTTLITTATEYAESFCNRPWRTLPKTELFSEFPSDCFTFAGDVQSVEQLSYYDTNHILTHYHTTRVASIGGRSYVYPAFGATWPTDSNGEAYSISIDYTTGRNDAVPSSVKSAILLLVGDLYENRENSVTGQGVTHVKMSLTAERLLTPYKTRAA